MIFEFDQQPVFMQNIQIDDIGNVALRCSNSKASKEYYIVIKTYLGQTALMKFGPVYPDISVMCDTMELSYKKFGYKESTIEREITKYINDVRACIDKVEIVQDGEALGMMPTAETFLNSL